MRTRPCARAAPSTSPPGVGHAPDRQPRQGLGRVEHAELPAQACRLRVEPARPQTRVEPFPPLTLCDDDAGVAPGEPFGDEVRQRVEQELVRLVELDEVLVAPGPFASARRRELAHAGAQGVAARRRPAVSRCTNQRGLPALRAHFCASVSGLSELRRK
jgi:hypothetical protein